MNAVDAPPEVESLIEQLGKVADQRALASAQALVRAVLDMHGAGLARILELVGASKEGACLVEALGRDDLVSSLLLLHGLHPTSLEARVRVALGRIGASGFTLELLGAGEGVVRVGVMRTGDPKRAAAGGRLRAIIEQAIERAAPDAEGLELVGELGDLDEKRAAFVPLDRLRTPGPAAGGDRS
jgi:hypothetical protein